MNYLEQDLSFYDDRIEVSATGTPVMMRWELPLMRRMAEIACLRRGDVLEIGFGMGLSAQEIQRLKPRSHTIIEAHPQIIARARDWAAQRPNVNLVGARWQDVIDTLGAYDGIAFDIFGGDGQRMAFFSHLKRLLRPKGVATLWLGDETRLPQELEASLDTQGFTYRLAKVSAIPDKRCTYSQSNEFFLPIIVRKEN
ncbi:MAG: class I SAM-dependent methyltransferase [Myxococcota bacterium]